MKKDVQVSEQELIQLSLDFYEMQLHIFVDLLPFSQTFSPDHFLNVINFQNK